MTWLGGIVLGLGVALVVVLAASRVRHAVLQRGGSAAEAASYAGRLGSDRENGAGNEVNRMADELIREHGAGAVIEAAHRAIAELDDDDRKGQAVWQRVLESAKESQHREGSGNGPAE
jgi:hypothetical protein